MGLPITGQVKIFVSVIDMLCIDEILYKELQPDFAGLLRWSPDLRIPYGLYFPKTSARQISRYL